MGKLQSTFLPVLSGSPIFLPRVGPFSSLGLVDAKSLPTRTISSFTTLQSTRRITPAKYNTLTVNVSQTLQCNTNDLCQFIWGNTLNMNGTISANGQDGGTNQGGDGADGGIGAGGGGGGGGTAACFCACTPCCCISLGGGGAGGQNGAGGSSGTGAFVGGTQVSSGGNGAAGRAANWASDGYNYVSNLSFDPELVGYPGGFGGDGGDAAHNAFGFVSGGGGGGAGGLLILVFNNVFGRAAGCTISAHGGSGGLDGSTMNFSGLGGDGGGVFVFARHYNGGLNGHVDVSGGAGLSGGNPGNSNLFKINPDNTITSNGFATPF